MVLLTELIGFIKHWCLRGFLNTQHSTSDGPWKFSNMEPPPSRQFFSYQLYKICGWWVKQSYNCSAVIGKIFQEFCCAPFCNGLDPGPRGSRRNPYADLSKYGISYPVLGTIHSEPPKGLLCQLSEKRPVFVHIELELGKLHYCSNQSTGRMTPAY